MKVASFTLTVVCLAIATAVVAEEEPNFPPPSLKLKEPWSTLDKKGFAAWEIDKFERWSPVPDGGSRVFIFLTTARAELKVLVANREYWTEEDKEKNRQVIYVIESDRFYLLVPGSKNERLLLRKLWKAEEGHKDKRWATKLALRALLAAIETRKPPSGRWWPLDREPNPDTPG